MSDPVRAVPVEERRHRLGVRHHLAPPAGGPHAVERVAGDLVGLHSSDPASVYLAARARVRGFTVADLADALYESRRLVRLLGMRRTLFVVPVELGRVVDTACTRAFASTERRRLVKLVADQVVDRPDQAGPWVDRVAGAVMGSLESRGEATAVELTEDVPELARRLTFGEGKAWGGETGLSTRLLFVLAAEGRIVRGRPRGSWLSSQYRWAPMGAWLGTDDRSEDEATARAELVRRWLRAFGPATETDVAWWTGWTRKATRAALGDVGAVPVGIPGSDGSVEGLLLPDDLDPTPAPEPWVALLPSLDPTTMGWKQREWYVGDHTDALFDRNGNAGPTVWADGRVIGGWAVGDGGEVRTRLLTDVGAETSAAVEAEAAALTGWLDGRVVKARFRTPLERELTGA